jgi:hypothetical protein
MIHLSSEKPATLPQKMLQKAGQDQYPEQGQARLSLWEPLSLQQEAQPARKLVLLGIQLCLSICVFVEMRLVTQNLQEDWSVFLLVWQKPVSSTGMHFHLCQFESAYQVLGVNLFEEGQQWRN